MNKVYKIEFYLNCPKLNKHCKIPVNKVYHSDSTKISQSWKVFYMCISINKLVTMGKLCRQSAKSQVFHLCSTENRRQILSNVLVS